MKYNEEYKKYVGNRWMRETLGTIDLNKLTIRGNTNNEPDEDGWVEVKKKKK